MMPSKIKIAKISAAIMVTGFAAYCNRELFLGDAGLLHICVSTVALLMWIWLVIGICERGNPVKRGTAALCVALLFLISISIVFSAGLENSWTNILIPFALLGALPFAGIGGALLLWWNIPLCIAAGVPYIVIVLVMLFHEVIRHD